MPTVKIQLDAGLKPGKVTPRTTTRSVLVQVQGPKGTVVEWVEAPPPPAPGGTVITGVGGVMPTLQVACDAGGSITIGAGELFAGAGVTKPVQITGAGAEKTILKGAIQGKAILVMRADVTLKDLTLKDAAVPDGNGAGVRLDGGNLRLLNVDLDGCQNGVMSGVIAGSYYAEGGVVRGCGGGAAGSTHGEYIGQCASSHIKNRTYRDNVGAGHYHKSRAARSTVEDCILGLGDGIESYELDFPNGGAVVVKGSTLRQGPSTGNGTMLAYGAESVTPTWPENSITISNTRFESTRPNGTGVTVSNFPNLLVRLDQVHFVGLAANKLVVGAKYTARGCTLDGAVLPDVNYRRGSLF